TMASNGRANHVFKTRC
ncbi:hypothetical protein D018_0395B, partial [Vibrio parahaemolyticus VP2007-007]